MKSSTSSFSGSAVSRVAEQLVEAERTHAHKLGPAEHLGARFGRLPFAAGIDVPSCHLTYLLPLPPPRSAFFADLLAEAAPLPFDFGMRPRFGFTNLLTSDSGIVHTGPRAVSSLKAFGKSPRRHQTLTVTWATPKRSAASVVLRLFMAAKSTTGGKNKARRIIRRPLSFLC